MKHQMIGDAIAERDVDVRNQQLSVGVREQRREEFRLLELVRKEMALNS